MFTICTGHQAILSENKCTSYVLKRDGKVIGHYSTRKQAKAKKKILRQEDEEDGVWHFYYITNDAETDQSKSLDWSAYDV